MNSQLIWTSNLIERCCPLCGSNDHIQVSHSMQFGFNLSTVICTKCSFVFTNPIPPHDVYERFYIEAYADYYGYTAPQPDGQQRQHIPNFIKQMLDQIEFICPLQSARLLEVGPGQGLFLWWAQQRGCEVLGIEPSKDFCLTLNQNNLPAIHGSLECVEVGQVGVFDIIAMSHVLEHFHDPNLALERCRSLLKSAGILVIVVPNILKPYRSLDHYFLRYVHPSNFSPQTLQAMLEKFGFEIVYLDEGGRDWYHPQNLFVIARKIDSYVQKSPQPKQQPIEILRYLHHYRWKWYLLISPAWYGQYTSAKARRLFYRSARKVKNLLTAK